METKSKNESGDGTAVAEHPANEALKTSKLMKLFEMELKDIYWAEKALTKALPKMIKQTTSGELSDALQSHLNETEEHVKRVESVFQLLEKKSQAQKCKAMAGLIDEAEEIMDDCDEGVMRDAGIIAAGQKVEHYEIGSYGTLIEYARTLGLPHAKELLEQTLQEEKAADKKLSEIAKNEVNRLAANTNDSEDK